MRRSSHRCLLKSRSSRGVLCLLDLRAWALLCTAIPTGAQAAPASDSTPETTAKDAPAPEAPANEGVTTEAGIKDAPASEQETSEAPAPQAEKKESAAGEAAPAESPRTLRVEVRREIEDGVEYEVRREWYEDEVKDAPSSEVLDQLPEDVRNMLPPEVREQLSASNDDAGTTRVMIVRQDDEDEDEDEAEAKVTATLKDGLRIAVPAGNHDLWFHPGVAYWMISQNTRGTTFGAEDIDGKTRVRQQIRANFDMGWGPLRAFMQVQDARDWGFEQSTVSNDGNIDLHQGFVAVRGSSNDGTLGGNIRLGRQEIWVGTRRLFAERPWNTNGQSFDALRLRGHAGKVRADLWAAMLAKPDSFDVDDGISVRTYQTRGGYVGMGVIGWDPLPAVSVEAMTAWVAEDKSEGDLQGQRRLASPGLRVFGDPVEGLRYDVEGYVQWGREPAVNRDHFAWAAAGTLSYTLRKEFDPKFHVGYSIASGEACDGDPSLGETCNDAAEGTRDFFDFYRRRHGYQGIVDMALWRNIRDLEAGVQLQLERRVRVNVDYHYFQLQEPTGRWWKVPEDLVGAGWDPQNRSRNLGHE
ncbi:MAG: alginate export family protein, partial [Nannocystaceae bacterium]